MDDNLIIAIGSDHAGFKLKEALRGELASKGLEVKDVGAYSEESCDYPDRGVLVCGTGAGMTMAANKVPGIRAVTCNEPYTAEYCRLHNDANVLSMGSRLIDVADAMNILEVFLSTGFEGASEAGARHLRRIEKIRDIERKYGKES
jgi:ribose 5-phosphate isomerase B